MTTVLLLLAVATSWFAFRLESWSPYVPGFIAVFFFAGLVALWMRHPFVGNLSLALVALIPVVALSDTTRRRRRARRRRKARPAEGGSEAAGS